MGLPKDLGSLVIFRDCKSDDDGASTARENYAPAYLKARRECEITAAANSASVAARQRHEELAERYRQLDARQVNEEDKA